MMGRRGPKPDPDQAAKGYPGRRRTKAVRVAEAAEALAVRLAPAVGAAALPALLQEPKYAPAAAVWQRIAPELKRTHRLPVESELHFIQLCIYAQEWVEATENLHDKGFQQSVKTVSGGRMERRRPQVFDRQQAFQNMLALSERFGLTPTDLYAIFKDQALALQHNPGLFGRDDGRPANPTPAAEPTAPAEPAAGVVGRMNAMDSAPPGSRPN